MRSALVKEPPTADWLALGPLLVPSSWSLLLSVNERIETICMIMTPVSSVSIENRVLDGEYQAIELAGDAPEAFNDTSHPDRVKPLLKKVFFSNGSGIFPPHSVTIISAKFNYEC